MIKKSMFLMIFAVVLLFNFTNCKLFAEDVVVIVHKDSSINEVSSGDLKKAFLGKKKKIASDEKLTVTTLKSGEAHESFLKSYVKKSPSQFSTFWKQAIFTGQGLPPKSFDSEEDLVKFVSENKGAIGYIKVSTPHDSVKVVTIK